ncbi:protein MICRORCHIDIA 7-like [Pistacia vera]|uniref:protein MICRORCHIDIA 7-like n=1 Tax=Pistacia vera TaxID=55513 RepID=UPI0012630E60|nr:protein MICRORCHIDIA 7-like [Pistacia vera]
MRSELNKKRSFNEFNNGYLLGKKPKLESPDFNTAISPKFLSFLPPPLPLNFVAPDTVADAEQVQDSLPVAADANENINFQAAPVLRACKQFWKAGDYEGVNADDSSINSVGMDHVRVHPKFLHSNATSHKWALGAFAELLDNSLDEVCHGATYVNVDMMKNKKDGSNMLLVEDNGGGMTPDKMRQCMSLGYSAKSKMANTIGQYGNGFKTSTMRLGADVIVFSCCKGNNGNSLTRSIGLLSYSFLMGTGKQDIVVPMIDYQRKGESWNKMIRSSLDDWNRNLETIVQWSPYTSEEDLFHQFNLLEDQGTRVIIYNLWEDDEGNLELDFDSDRDDIQIRGVNRDEKNIEMAKKYPNSRHFLTYRHSLRSYASILYLRLPAGFRIILRGKDVLHHNIINDMMLTKEITYKPLHLPERVPRDLNMVATVTIGFVKDARHHIDVQGFNVYHKNRLIKPFWRVWNAAGSDGRGAIGVLEANFVEPAHDKQGFERTPVLLRLENRLVAIQKNYWCTNCQEVGYAPRRPSLKSPVSEKTDSRTSDKEKPSTPSKPASAKTDSRTSDEDKCSSPSNQNERDHSRSKTKLSTELDKRSPESDNTSEDGSSHEPSPVSGQSQHAPRLHLHETRLHIPRRPRSNNAQAAAVHEDGRILSNVDTESLIKSKEKDGPVLFNSATESLIKSKENDGRVLSNGDIESLIKSKEKDHKSIERLETKDSSRKDDLPSDLQYERDKCRSLENQLQKAQQKIEEMDQEQITLIDMIQEERGRRDAEEDRLREKLREASSTINDLLAQVKWLEERRGTP